MPRNSTVLLFLCYLRLIKVLHKFTQFYGQKRISPDKSSGRAGWYSRTAVRPYPLPHRPVQPPGGRLICLQGQPVQPPGRAALNILAMIFMAQLQHCCHNLRSFSLSSPAFQPQSSNHAKSLINI